MFTADMLNAWASDYPWLYLVGALTLLGVAAWFADEITRRVLLRVANRVLNATRAGRDPLLGCDRVVAHLAHLIPAWVIWAGITAIPALPEALVAVVRNVSAAFMILTLARAVSALLNTVNALYLRKPDNLNRPIKGYLQVVRIAVYAVATILMVATLIDRSPLILLSGLGAMAAVLMLVFQDTLLSLVASVQISSSDIVRVGDWIEMPQLNVDGFVIDIALHTVRVQNWDKTISSFPTRKLISEPFKNWRGMQESGGRRIKRSLCLDQTSVRFLSHDEQESLRRFVVLRPYLDEKQQALTAWNQAVAERGEDPVNARRITNVGTFRAYVEHYLRGHPGINQEMLMLVRQMSPTAEGLPLELYCFTRSVAWVDYEGVQADIFDHLFAILPEFGLRIFQKPSGADIRGALGKASAGRMRESLFVPESEPA